jgi:glycosyltransferase involved in cell wall biosynthesis
VKITFVLAVADHAGGIRVIATYAERLKQRGHEVTIVSRRPAKRTLSEQLRGLVTEGQWLPRRRSESSHIDGIGVTHHLVDGVRPIGDSDVPDGDVVIATWWETANWVDQLSPRKGRKVYFIQHHEVFPYLPIAEVEATYRLPELRKITISRWLADIMRDTYGDPDTRLVMNSVDTDLFFAPARGKQQRPTVGLIYHDDPGGWKGGDVAVKALARVKAVVPDLRVVSFGFRPPNRELPLPEGSTFVASPPQSQIRDLYAQCDVWLCASRSEGFCLPVLEAMACRCPVVSTRVGGAPDLIEEGLQGYVVDVEDSEGLAERLVQVLSLNEAAWRRMSAAAFSAATSYTWDDATNAFEAALFEAATRRTDERPVVDEARDRRFQGAG